MGKIINLDEVRESHLPAALRGICHESWICWMKGINPLTMKAPKKVKEDERAARKAHNARVMREHKEKKNG